MNCKIKLNFKTGEVKEFTGSAQVMTCGFIEVTFQTEEGAAGSLIAGVKKSVTEGYPLNELSSYEIVGE